MLKLNMKELTAAIDRNAHTPAAPWQYAEIVLESAEYLSHSPTYNYTVTIQSDLQGSVYNGLVYRVTITDSGECWVVFKRFAHVN